MGEKNERPPRDGGLCQSKPEPSLDLELNILHVNIRGLLSHKTELEARLAKHGKPEVVRITETHLDKSVAAVSLCGYTQISRLDRRDGRKQRSIALYALASIANTVVHIGYSADHDRSWNVLHSNLEPLPFRLWYRPPS